MVGVDHHTGEVFVRANDEQSLHDTLRSIDAIARPRAPVTPPPIRLVSETSPDQHLQNIAKAQELIRQGHIYQVNLARALRLALASTSPPAVLEVLFRMARRAPTPFGAMIHWGDVMMVSTSPELVLDTCRVGGTRQVWTEPIKGTRPRGVDRASDQALRLQLDGDEKEQAELSMIVDVERNDLHRVAAPGTVRVVRPPSVVSFGPVHHRTALLRANLAPSVTNRELLSAILPSGSVTGAPKIRAMEVIRLLEHDRRGLYTGAYGYISFGGEFRLAMAIRTLDASADGDAHYFTGGGIVADSMPSLELEETRLKTAQLANLLCAST